MSKFWAAFPFDEFDATDVSLLYKHFFRQLYNSVSRVILIKGLDDLPNVDYDYIIFQLLMSGKVFMFKQSNDIYILDGHPAGKWNVNYMPEDAETANPYFKGTDIRRTINKDGVLIYLTPFDKVPVYIYDNTKYGGGLYTLLASTAMLLADNYSSLNCAQLNGRVQVAYTAEDDIDAKSAEKVLKRMYQGHPYSVIKSSMLNKFTAQPLGANTASKVITELIEAHQYILAQFWNSIGIDANFNMKRERLVKEEVEANSTSLKVPVSTMLKMLNSGFKTANEIFGTSISAELNPEFKPIEPLENSDNNDDNNGDNKDGDNNEPKAKENNAGEGVE